MAKRPKLDLDLMLDVMSEEDLIKLAITKANQINRKIKNVSDKTSYGKYYQRHVKLNISNTHLFTKTGNVSKSTRKLKAMSNAMLKQHIRQLDSVLTDENYRTIKSTEKHIKEQIKIEESTLSNYSFDNKAQVQAWKMTLQERYGNDFNEMLQYIYNGNVEAFYSEFLLRKESLYIDLADNSDDVIDNMYTQYEQTIERNKEEAQKRLDSQYRKKLQEKREQNQKQKQNQNQNQVQNILSKYRKQSPTKTNKTGKVPKR